LNGGSARRKSITYTRQHKHSTNANIHASCSIRSHDPQKGGITFLRSSSRLYIKTLKKRALIVFVMTTEITYMSGHFAYSFRVRFSLMQGMELETLAEPYCSWKHHSRFQAKKRFPLLPPCSTLMNLPPSSLQFVCLLMTGFNRDRIPDLFAWMR
jgi:hypothetical protein